MISVINATKNRDILYESLITWLDAGVDEVVIVDWSSDEPIRISSRKVRVIRVEDQPRWILTWAYNLAAFCASGDVLMKLDADYQLKPNFFELTVHPVESKVYVSGDWRDAPTDNDKHLNGFLMVHQKDFWSVGGYHEGITTYGYDDTDLHKRLSQRGLKRVGLDLSMIRHIPHDNVVRTQHQDVEEVLDRKKQLQRMIQTNRRVSERHLWSAEHLHWWALGQGR